MKNAWLRLIQVVHIIAILFVVGNYIVYSYTKWDQLSSYDGRYWIKPYEKKFEYDYTKRDYFQYNLILDVNSTTNFISNEKLLTEAEAIKGFDLLKAIGDFLLADIDVSPKVASYIDYINEKSVEHMPLFDFYTEIEKINIPAKIDNQHILDIDGFHFVYDDEDIKKYEEDIGKILPNFLLYKVAFNGVDGHITLELKHKNAPDFLSFYLHPKVSNFDKINYLVHSFFSFMVWYFMGIVVFGVISTIIIYIIKGRIVLNPYYAFQKPKEPTP